MAADDDESSKTEEPTSKRLSDAREKGQVISSREVTNFIMMGGISVVVLVAGPWIAMTSMRGLKVYLEQADMLRLNTATLADLTWEIIVLLLTVLAVPFLLMMVLGVVSSLLQHGWVFSTEPLLPKLSKLSPLAGLKRIFSLTGLLEMLKGTVKMTLVGSVAYAVLLPFASGLEPLVSSPVEELPRELWALALPLLLSVTALLAVLAVGDWFFRRYEHLKQLRMTKTEVKDEYRQMEGDPAVKGKIRQMRIEKSRQRMAKAVPTASVVVTNPTHYAVALKYEMGQSAAPIVVAKGLDWMALRIRQLAKENDVPIVENPPLARALYDNVDVDEEIPAEHYRAVAEVIGFIMRLKGKRLKK